MPKFATLSLSYLSTLGVGLGLLHLAGGPSFVQAQTLPSPIQPDGSQLDMPPEILPSPEELLQNSPTSTTTPDPDVPSESLGEEDTIIVQQFQVQGSTVFTPEELAAVTTPFTERPITFSEVLDARSAVTQLYIDNGYVTSGAYIPANQVMDNGIVTIEVIEGSVEDIEVSGLERLRSKYVRDRLALGAKQPLNTQELLEALQLLQLDPLIETLSAELSAGPRPGVNLLKVTVKEARSLKADITLDNSRVPSLGSFQRQIKLSEGNLVGMGDGIQIGYSNSDGSNEVNVSYEVPVNARNGSIKASFSQSWSHVIEEPFDRLDLNGTSRNINLGFRQPVIQSPQKELALGIKMGRRESETTLLGERFPLSPGSDENGRTKITGLNLTQEWTQRQRQSVLALRSDFGIGLDAFATENPEPPDGRFFLRRGQAQWVRQVAPETLVLLRSNLQFSDRALVPLEQFGLGGSSSVRGYRQDQLLVDNGVYGSAEARIPLYRTPDRKGVLQVAPFLDFGQGWNNGDRPIDGSNTLVAAGLGLRWRWSDRVNASLNWGIPLTSVGTQSSGVDDSQLFFSVTGNIF